SISGLVVKSIVAIDGPRVRFTANAFFTFLSVVCVCAIPTCHGTTGGGEWWMTHVRMSPAAICAVLTRFYNFAVFALGCQLL
ncbi:hypothetical protein F4802DRAFT_582506, partial [Xylaria palmicola]